MLVVAAVSSRNTRRSGSSAGWRRMKAWRASATSGRCCSAACRLFFLGRQSLLLEGALFEGGEVGGRIPAEAGAQDPGVVALFQTTSGFAPFDKIDRRQVR